MIPTSRDGGDELETRIRRGDEKALAEAFSIHRPRLWRMVNFRLDGRLAGRVDPDDVLQEVWLAAVRRLEHYGRDLRASPFVWLRMIVQQTLIDIHREHLGAQMRDAGREVSISGAPSSQATSVSLAMHLVGDWTSPSHAAVRNELLALVEKAIESMDPIDREVLALRHFEELTNTEVSEVLDIQPKAASIRYVRAIRRLKAILSTVPGLSDERPEA
jgi:RNA polymerase sigma-70 factor (ECF subfamily)